MKTILVGALGVLAASLWFMFGTDVFRLLCRGFADEPFHVLGAVLLALGLLFLPFLIRRVRKC